MIHSQQVRRGCSTGVRHTDTLKYEEVYLKDYASVTEARAGIDGWFRFYNHERLHQNLGYRTPAALYKGRT